jgi:transglutaminase-like putative cysteine protease
VRLRIVSVAALLFCIGCHPPVEEEEVLGVPAHVADAVEAAGSFGLAPEGYTSVPRLNWRVEIDGRPVDEFLVLAGNRGVRGRYESGPALDHSVDPIALGMITAPSVGVPVRDVAVAIAAAVHDRVEQTRIVARAEPGTTWAARVGDCTEMADLTAAALRGLGIDAHVIGGAAPAGNEMRAHAWVEFDDGGTWVGIDPTWNTFPLSAGYVPLDRGLLTRDLTHLEAIGDRVRVYAQ